MQAHVALIVVDAMVTCDVECSEGIIEWRDGNNRQCGTICSRSNVFGELAREGKRFDFLLYTYWVYQVSMGFAMTLGRASSRTNE